MKRILCLLLAMLMVLPLAVACAKDEQPPVVTDDGTEPADSTAPDGTDPVDTEPPAPVRAHSVPVDELDFGNAEFSTIAYEWQGYPYYFFSDDDTSDPMSAALYNRRMEIEEELGVKMTYFMYKNEKDMSNTIMQDVLNGSSAIDLALFHCINGLAQMSSNAYLYPLEMLEYVDLEADWWNLTQMDALRGGENYYLGVNDYMIPCPYVIFFNKDLIEDLGLDDPYQLVHDQAWTYDAFIQMARAATKDVNTDGVYDSENDSFGIACDEVSNYVSFISAFDQPLAAKDENGKFVVAMNTEKMADIVADFAELSKEKIFYPDISTHPNDQITMDSGRLLFLLSPITVAERLRDCEVPYGILPYPKYDEAQADYRTLDWGGLMGVPSVVEDPDMVGAVLELLAFKAEEEVIPAYYDVVLDGQLAQDPESSKMLDVIFDTICYEPAINYWGLYSPYMQLVFVLSHQAIWKQNGNFASIYAQYGAGAQLQIDTFYETLEIYEDYNAAFD